MGEDQMEDYALEFTDMLASDERVATVARTRGRRGDRTLVNDFVQLTKIHDRRIVVPWNYWEQRAVVEFMTSPAVAATPDRALGTA